MSEKIYAAYGSNLNVEQMAFRCPDAVRVQKAVLENHTLVFRGSRHYAVATIEPKEGSSVPVMLWSISDRDERALDRYEGYPSLYTKETMSFNVGDQKVEAMVYVMTPGHQLGLPSVGYYSAILQGYRDCDLDPALLEQSLGQAKEIIEAMNPSNHELDGFRMW